MIVAEMKKGGGVITHADLQGYEAKWRDPIVGRYKEFRIISMGPPSSGGIALLQLMSMLEPINIHSWGVHDPRTVHRLLEAERRVFADRAQHLGDMDFYPVPVQGLLNKPYNLRR